MELRSFSSVSSLAGDKKTLVSLSSLLLDALTAALMGC
jgi:hypothetical protein